MDIFRSLFCAAITTLLCLFLIRSRIDLLRPLTGKAEATLIGSWLFLCVLGICIPVTPAQAVSATMAAGFLYWCLGRSSIPKALLFGFAFGLLRLISSAAPLLLSNHSPSVTASSAVFLELVALYSLTVGAAALRDRWRPVLAPLLPLIPRWLVAVLLCEEVIRNQSYDSVIVLEILAFLWFLYAGILLHQVGNKLEDKLRRHLEKQQKVHHYALQEEYYQLLRSKQAETRALWHDLNKYLRSAKAETPSAQALEQLEAMLGSATEIVDVGNTILNVILNEYAQMAKATGVELRMKVQVPEKLSVSVADLYILIGNTMDNAIEACHALPPEQRMIDLTLRTHNDVLFFKLTNPYVSEQPKQNTDPMHGHGLQNVRRCVEKYGGTVDWTKENGFFSITAHLNLPT
jgi:hypothetical protein